MQKHGISGTYDAATLGSSSRSHSVRAVAACGRHMLSAYAGAARWRTARDVILLQCSARAAQAEGAPRQYAVAQWCAGMSALPCPAPCVFMPTGRRCRHSRRPVPMREPGLGVCGENVRWGRCLQAAGVGERGEAGCRSARAGARRCSEFCRHAARRSSSHEEGRADGAVLSHAPGSVLCSGASRRSYVFQKAVQRQLRHSRK